MSEWRPEGWVATKQEWCGKRYNDRGLCDLCPGNPLTCCTQEEFLVDAMLAALRERAKKCAESSVLLREHLENVQPDGVWVFIPEAPSVPAHEKEVGA